MFFFSRYLLMTNKKIIIFRKLMHFMDSTRFEIIEMVFFIQKYLIELTSLNGFVLELWKCVISEWNCVFNWKTFFIFRNLFIWVLLSAWAVLNALSDRATISSLNWYRFFCLPNHFFLWCLHLTFGFYVYLKITN